MPLTNGGVIFNFKINSYLKFCFFNSWNLPLTERTELVGTCPALILTQKISQFFFLPNTPLKNLNLEVKTNSWCVIFHIVWSVLLYTKDSLRGYPHRMRLQRRLYCIYFVCFFKFMIPCNYKLSIPNHEISHLQTAFKTEDFI